MQLTLSSVITATIGLLSITASAQTKYPFRLRAWRDTRFGTPPPVINHYVEINKNREVVINKTANYAGFESYLWPTPEEGTLSKFDDDVPGYLFPLHGVQSNPPTPATHYQLKYGGIPKISGVLYTNFTTVGRGCGAMCGGATLDYDIGGDRGYGEWYIIKDEDEYGEVWKVRWMGIKSAEEAVNYPTGAIPVFLWKF